MSFPFDELPNVAVITCSHVLNNNEPILYVSHDEEDGKWQFLCGETHTMKSARAIGLREIYEHDKTITAIAKLPLGCYALRGSVGENWIVSKR